MTCTLEKLQSGIYCLALTSICERGVNQIKDAKRSSQALVAAQSHNFFETIPSCVVVVLLLVCCRP